MESGSKVGGGVRLEIKLEAGVKVEIKMGCIKMEVLSLSPSNHATFRPTAC